MRAKTCSTRARTCLWDLLCSSFQPRRSVWLRSRRSLPGVNAGRCPRQLSVSDVAAVYGCGDAEGVRMADRKVDRASGALDAAGEQDCRCVEESAVVAVPDVWREDEIDHAGLVLDVAAGDAVRGRGPLKVLR